MTTTLLPPTSRPRILCLDDDPLLVRVTARVLEHHGFDVAGYTTATEAIEEFRRSPASFDLLITDHVMPGRSGLEVVAELRAMRPELRVLLMTGFVTPQLERDAEVALVDAILAKPHLPEELIAVIRRVLTL